MKRFYKSSTAVETDGGFAVHLDGRAVRSPAKAPLILPTLALAQAVSDEWNAQGDKIVPDSMAQMSLGSTAIDRVVPNREVVADEAAGFAGSDLLCYRAERPESLTALQMEGWDPILDWAAQRYDVHFDTTAGIMPIAQPDATLSRMRDVAHALNPFELTAVHVMTTAYGSFLLALSVFNGERTPQQALDLSRIDEAHQAERWGEEEEARKRRERLSGEVEAAHRFLTLLRQG